MITKCNHTPEELCEDCKAKNETTVSNSRLIDGLSDAVFHEENNLLVLRTPEGWMLWNSTNKGNTTLGELIERANLNLESGKKDRDR